MHSSLRSKNKLKVIEKKRKKHKKKKNIQSVLQGKVKKVYLIKIVGMKNHY